MIRVFKSRLLPVGLALGLMVPAWTVAAQDAAAEAPGVRTETNNVATLLQSLKELERDIDAGKGRLARLTPQQKADINSNRLRVEGILQGYDVVEDVPMQRRVDAYNAMAAIDGIVNNLPTDQREVCRRERPVGSNRAVTVCRSVMDSQADHQTTRDIHRIQEHFIYRGEYRAPVGGGTGWGNP